LAASFIWAFVQVRKAPEQQMTSPSELLQTMFAFRVTVVASGEQ